MLGDALLVAPVFSADGTVTFYVPDGTWTHLLDGAHGHRAALGHRDARLRRRCRCWCARARCIPIGARDDRPGLRLRRRRRAAAVRAARASRPAPSRIPALGGGTGADFDVARDGDTHHRRRARTAAPGRGPSCCRPVPGRRVAGAEPARRSRRDAPTGGTGSRLRARGGDRHRYPCLPTAPSPRRIRTHDQPDTHLPRRISLGVGDRVVPDRGRRRRGRRGPSRSGTPTAARPGRVLNGDTGDVADDHYHRWPQDVGADQGPRPAGLPVLAGLAADPAGRVRARSTRRASTSTRGWSTGCWSAGVAPGRHAVPLGPAAGAGGRRRLGRPGHRAAVRGLRRARRRRARRPDARLDDAERAVVLGVPRLRAPACTRPVAPNRPAALAAAHHLNLGARPGRPGGPRRAGAEQPSCR